MISEVSSLCHKIGDDSMEMRALIPESFFMCAESPKVSRSFRCFFIEQLEDKLSRLIVSKVDFKENVFECHRFD